MFFILVALQNFFLLLSIALYIYNGKSRADGLIEIELFSSCNRENDKYLFITSVINRANGIKNCFQFYK